MSTTLTGDLEALIKRLMASTRYRGKAEVVRAGLRKLEAVGQTSEALEHFPQGSLRRRFTAKRNADELSLLKGSSLAMEDESGQVGWKTDPGQHDFRDEPVGAAHPTRLINSAGVTMATPNGFPRSNRSRSDATT